MARWATRFGTELLLFLRPVTTAFSLRHSRTNIAALGWDQSHRAYIMTYGVSGIDWKHYKHPLPENVYDVFMKCWEEVRFDV